MSHTSLLAVALFCLALIAVPAAAIPTELTPTPVAPVASFSASPTAGVAPLNVSFTDTSSGLPSGWAWYFGDENYTASAWTQRTDGAAWSARSGHSSVVLPDGSIVLMGGFDGVNYMRNVFRSTDRGATWTRQTDTAGWAARREHASVALPDGSIVLMGGIDSTVAAKNDVWRSTDKGVTWTRVNESAGWAARWGHTAVALPDGSIVLMGGATPGGRNDVWRSTDRGSTWTRVNESAGWSPRDEHTSVVLPDGSIVLMGGNAPNDVWRSTDRGATWTEQTSSAGWAARHGHTSVALPDGSMVLMGGYALGYTKDVWRSTDRGTTWTEQTTQQIPWTGWTARNGHTGVALPDGSIVLMGGTSPNMHDVWRLETASSTARNPFHVYAAPGSYTVALRASNAVGYTDAVRPGYVTVTAVLAVPPGSALPTDTNADGKYDDVNGNGRKDFSDVVLYFNRMSWIAANEPVSLFDYNKNGRIDFADVVWLFSALG